jgi:DNA-binding NarL/FixJ family response regulator
MIPKRVFIIWNNPLFHESVRLLLNHSEIEWLGSTSDIKAAKDEILELKPDTILIEELQGRTSMEVMGILESQLWNVRIFGLNLTDNTLHVYHHQEQKVLKADDLVRLILSNT